MRPLGPRDRRRGSSRGSLEGWLHLDLQVLAMQTQAGVPLVPSGPVAPEEGSRADRQGMKQDAHLARFARFAPVPLTAFTERTRTAAANAGGIDDPQTAITLSTAFMRDQRLACWTAQGPSAPCRRSLDRSKGAGGGEHSPSRTTSLPDAERLRGHQHARKAAKREGRYREGVQVLRAW